MVLPKVKPKASPKNSDGQDKLVELMLDTGKPSAQRAKMLLDTLMTTFPDPAQLLPLLTKLLDKAGKQDTTAEVKELKAKFQAALGELEKGSTRPATMIGLADGDIPGLQPRAHVITPDGQERFPFIGPQLDVTRVSKGSTVYLDAKGAVMLGFTPRMSKTGQGASFLRKLPDDEFVEVSIHDESFVVHASQHVLDAVAADELQHGDRVLVCPRRQFAFIQLPKDENRQHRFIDTAKIPEVVASRDIGKPHWILPWMLRRLRIIMFRPELLERYELRPRVSVLMTGSTGTGKTLTIKAFLHEFYQMIVERTGRQDIGSRVIRVKVSELLSEWLGRSDKNIDELFDDVLHLASQMCKTADGQEVQLPVAVILEEAEGIAQRRGGSHDGGVYDRIIGTLLQRMDDPTDDLAKTPLIWITTSNRPDMFDAAMWRRWAGVRAHFPRLDREGVAAVLGKKLKVSHPYASNNGTPAGELRQEAIDRVVTWLFSPNGEDRGVVEITLRDGIKLTKYRSDFLTGAVLETAVSRAVDDAAFEEDQMGQVDERHGISAELLIGSLRSQIDDIADILTAGNCSDYVDLPEHTGVAAVRRLRSSSGPLEYVDQ